MKNTAGPPVAAPLDPRLAIAAAGIVAVIVYGSLFPFHFQARLLPDGPLSELLNTQNTPFDRGDSVSNVLLYVPFGLFFARALRTVPRWALTPLVTLAGFVLSMCMEMAQFYDPGRGPSMADVYMNTAGAFIGALAATCLKRDLVPSARVTLLRQEIVWRPFAILLIACWLGNRFCSLTRFPAARFSRSTLGVSSNAPTPRPWCCSICTSSPYTGSPRRRYWNAAIRTLGR